MKTIGTMRAIDEARGAIRMEDVYDTDIDDLWQACTTPDRLARWIAQVSGDLRVGGDVRAMFTSTWNGVGRIEVCEPPRHLLMTMEPGTTDEAQIEAWLTEEGDGTRLVVEERGLPLSELYFHGAGWQAHLEDLGTSLASGEPVHADGWSPTTSAHAWQQRWNDLTPTYRDMKIDGAPLTPGDR